MALPYIVDLEEAQDVADMLNAVIDFTNANNATVGRPTGRYWPTFGGSVSTSVAVTAADTLYVVPFRLREPITLTGMAIRIVTGGAASSVKMGIWAHSSATARPTGTPITNAVSNTGQATATSSAVATVPMTATLAAGIYWAGGVFTGTLPTPVTNNDSQVMFDFLGRASLASNATIGGLSTAFTYSNDITTLNLTGATWADASGGVPVFNLVS